MRDDSNATISALLRSIKALREYYEIPLDALSFMTGIDISRLQEIEEYHTVPTLHELQSILSTMDCHIDILRDRDYTRPACLSERFPKKRSVVLVIGNGFDKALGLNTLYTDFISSPFWPFNGEMLREPETGELYASPFAEYIYKAVVTDKRSDLEAIMREFCIERIEEQKRTGAPYMYADADYSAFDLLSKALQAYLKKEQGEFMADKDRLEKAQRTTACHVLLELLHSGDDVFIHSFNYTDIEKLAYSLDVLDPKLETFEDWARGSCWYHQMHSSVYGRHIVLGLEEDCPIPESMSFLRKVNNPSYIPSNILRDMADADSVVFFGHSLSKIDQCYFMEFFAEQSKAGLPKDKSKDITFYTLNEKSGNSIMTNLKSMEGVDIVNLTSNNNFSIQYTAGK